MKCSTLYTRLFLLLSIFVLPIMAKADISASIDLSRITSKEVTVLYAAAPGHSAMEKQDIKAGIFSHAISQALSADSNKPLSQNEFIRNVRINTRKLSSGKQSPHVINPWVDGRASICGKATHILTIGINYTNTSAISLAYAVSDAKNTAAAFAKQCQNTVISSYLEKQATTKNIIAAIKKVTAQAKKEDVVVVAFSGYGVAVNSKNYLLPENIEVGSAASKNQIQQHGINVDQITSMLNLSEAEHNLLMLDTCTVPFSSSVSR